MKLLPRPPKNVRVNTEDSLGHGMDAVIMLAMNKGVHTVWETNDLLASYQQALLE